MFKYLTAVNQANEVLHNICSILPHFQNDPEGQVPKLEFLNFVTSKVVGSLPQLLPLACCPLPSPPLPGSRAL